MLDGSKRKPFFLAFAGRLWSRGGCEAQGACFFPLKSCLEAARFCVFGVLIVPVALVAKDNQNDTVWVHISSRYVFTASYFMTIYNDKEAAGSSVGMEPP